MNYYIFKSMITKSNIVSERCKIREVIVGIIYTSPKELKRHN